MSRAVTSVATVCLLLAIAREVTSAVTLEALFPLAAEARVAADGAAAALRALPGEMPRPVAFVAYARTHVCDLL